MHKIKNFIKEYYKIIIIYIVLIGLVTINLPFYINSPGGLLDTKEKIKTESNIKLKGSINMTYVSERHATLPTFLWSYIAKDWDLEKEKEYTGDEKIEDIEFRNKLLLKESNNNTLIVAYKNSNIDYEISNRKIYITYIDKEAKTNLEVKDQITEVDGKKITDKSILLNYIASKKIGDKVKFKTNKNKIKTATIIEIDGKPKVGVLITELYDVKSKTKVKFNFSQSEYGPSGGLMTTLALYTQLNKIDITKGRKIAGTGTIDVNGKVGEIGGVKYKLIGAINNKCDIFIVPKGDNYKEVEKLKKEREYKIKIIPVDSFEEALRKLSK